MMYFNYVSESEVSIDNSPRKRERITTRSILEPNVMPITIAKH
jgi:hypothetical protein